MNKKELINATADRANFFKKDVAEMMDALISVTYDALADGEKVSIGGLVTLQTVDIPRRMVRNPKNEERVWQEAHKKIKVKVCETLYNFVNSERNEEAE